jgi:hypothetical protein
MFYYYRTLNPVVTVYVPPALTLINQFSFYPQCMYMSPLVYSVAAIISLKNINHMIFVMVMVWGFSEVGTQVFSYYIKALLWLRRLVTGLWLQRSGFGAGSVIMGFEADKLALGQVFLWVCGFLL